MAIMCRCTFQPSDFQFCHLQTDGLCDTKFSTEEFSKQSYISPENNTQNDWAIKRSQIALKLHLQDIEPY